jgi:hypothetical protein
MEKNAIYYVIPENHTARIENNLVIIEKNEQSIKEACFEYSIKNDIWYISSTAEILSLNTTYFNNAASKEAKNDCLSEQTARAFLALIELRKYADFLNKDATEHKRIHVIIYFGDFFAFETAEIRNKFEKEFADLIKIAKYLFKF